MIRLWQSLLLLLALPLPAAALSDLSVGQAEARLEGRQVPDIPLQLTDGRRVMLSELGRDQDLLVTFFYRRCVGVCTPFLQWVADATAEVGGLGEDYRILALSIDNSDGPAQLAAQARALRVADHPDWFFAVTTPEALAEITGALEFWYRALPDSDQYDHGSLLAAMRDGRVLRALRSGPGETQRLRELVWELRGGFLASYPVASGGILRCFSYDPASGKLRLEWGLLLLILPALAALMAALIMFRPRFLKRPDAGLAVTPR